jgi:hypothetical protein
MQAAAALTTQTFAARAISRQTKRWASGLAACCERVKGACALVVGSCSWTARLGLAACAFLVGNGVGAGESARRGCWVSVQSSVMSDHYQSTTS